MEYRWFKILTQDEYDAQHPSFVSGTERRRDIYFVCSDATLGLKIRNIDRRPVLERKVRQSRTGQGVEEWAKTYRRSTQSRSRDMDEEDVVFRCLRRVRKLDPEYLQYFRREAKVVCASVEKMRQIGRRVSEQVLLKVRYYVADASERTYVLDGDTTVLGYTASVEGCAGVSADVVAMTEGSRPMGYPEWLFVTHQNLQAQARQ